MYYSYYQVLTTSFIPNFILFFYIENKNTLKVEVYLFTHLTVIRMYLTYY